MLPIPFHKRSLPPNNNFQHIRLLNMMQCSYTPLVPDWDTPQLPHHPPSAACTGKGNFIWTSFSSCFMWGWSSWHEGWHAWTPGCRQWLWARKAPVPVPECAFPLQSSQNHRGVLWAWFSSSLVSKCTLILHLQIKTLPGVSFLIKALSSKTAPLLPVKLCFST